MEPLTYIAIALGSAAVGAFGAKFGELLFEQIKQRLAGRKAVACHLTGQWYAAWQTTVDGIENLNTELIKIDHIGTRLTITNVEKSPENKLGGYLWRADMSIYENERAIGVYVSTEPNVTSKGALYLVINRVGSLMRGQWVGCNYDYVLTSGYGVIAKERDVALDELRRLLDGVTGQPVLLLTNERNRS